jgi:hypothetical protein
MAVRLVIGDTAYVLSQLRGGEWVELATLEGGASKLLPPTRSADAAGLEFAIEVAEDWLMPHARSLQGEDLEVIDDSGQLASGLARVLAVAEREWSIEGLEEIFGRVVDLATGRHSQLAAGDQRFIADIVLLRELAHHARLRQVRLVG